MKINYQLPEFWQCVNADKIYRYNELENVLSVVRKNFRFSWTNKKYKYFDVPCAFDIETSNIIDENVGKRAFMYVWNVCIYGLVIQGRTWEEYVFFTNELKRLLDLGDVKRVIFYVHNLDYEFQFIRKWFTWNTVFSAKSRDVIYAVDNGGIEYRCSEKLAGYGLDTVGKNLTRYTRTKKVGFLDYEKLRHKDTVLTYDENLYCIEDVKVLACYIAEQIENNGGLGKIPLTKTGFARELCRNNVWYDHTKNVSKRAYYNKLIKSLTFTVDEFKQVERAYYGGFTHGNPFYAGKILHKAVGYDITSSYPTQAIAERYPMSKGKKYDPVDYEDFTEKLDLYACIFTVELNDISPLCYHEFYISKSKCEIIEGETVYNGRVVYADRLVLTITEVDYKIIEKMYTWDKYKMKIVDMYIYKKAYLPTDLVRTIVKLYKDKTELKGVEGKEVEYLYSKEVLNSASYGMFVTNPVKKEDGYLCGENRWPELIEIGDKDYSGKIDKYNKSVSRFTFYLWGVYIAAYARRSIFDIILNLDEKEYIYTDTDSVKMLNAEKYFDLINGYNKNIVKKLDMACEYHGINPEDLRPYTKDGNQKQLGIWDFDGAYNRIKFHRAKCYAVEYSEDPRNGSKCGKFEITVAGLGKKAGSAYMQSEENVDPFDKFSSDLIVPAEHTGKLTHTYCDYAINGKIVDHNGVEGEYKELSFIHLGACEFSMSVDQKITDFIKGVYE